jgi:hypothetical protein
MTISTAPFIIASIAALAFCGYWLGDALTKGYFSERRRTGFGHIRRKNDPIRYWVTVSLVAVFCALGFWILLITLGLQRHRVIP